MIPFVRDFDFTYGEPEAVSPLIRRVVANNPGPFTFTGTGVYIIGHGTVAVVDPGPDLPDHWQALLTALDGEQVSHVFVTHGHLDHSPLARRLARHFGAKVYASPQVPIPTDSEVRLEAGDDLDFRPDVGLADGDTFTGPGWTLTALATPGHTSGHMCYALAEEQALFSGDHIMGWSTSVISPPDGDMSDYMNSLGRILAMDFQTLWPTHGPPITTPQPFIEAYIAHREAREAAILSCLQNGPATIPAMVKQIYTDVDTSLHPAACHSVLAHMIKLLKDGRVATDSATPDLTSQYRLRPQAA